jgi:hypothetical protein
VTTSWGRAPARAVVFASLIVLGLAVFASVAGSAPVVARSSGSNRVADRPGDDDEQGHGHGHGPCPPHRPPPPPPTTLRPPPTTLRPPPTTLPPPPTTVSPPTTQPTTTTQPAATTQPTRTKIADPPVTTSPPDPSSPRPTTATVAPEPPGTAASSSGSTPVSAQVLGESVTATPTTLPGSPSNAGAGRRTEALGIPEVPPSPPPPEASGRSTISSGLADHVDFSPVWVAGNLGLGALILLALLAASQLFNDALRVHHDLIASWLGSRSSLLGRTRGLLVATPHPPPLLTFALAAALLGRLADPRAAFSATTVAQVLGMSLALVLLVGIYEGSAAHMVRSRSGIEGTYRLYPLAIVVAIACLGLSRFLHVAPGLLYGLVVGVVFAGAVEREVEGRAYARSSALLVGAALAAYGLHRLVSSSAGAAGAGFWVILIDSAAAALFVGGMQAVIVQLLPMRFVNGEKVAAWSRAAWFLLLAGSLALYVQFVVRPSNQQQSWANLWFVLGLVLLAAVFWAWCSVADRHRTKASPTAGTKS